MRHTDGQQTHKKVLNIPNNQGDTMRTTMTYLTPARMAIIKKKTNKTDIGKGIEKREPSYTVVKM